MIDLTPHAIAARLLPDGATPEMRLIAVAMAEAALRALTARTEFAKLVLVERLMARAGKAVYDQHIVRCQRVYWMRSRSGRMRMKRKRWRSDEGI